MNAFYSLATVPSEPSGATPLDGMWIFCIASYGCGVDGYASRRAANGLFQSGIAVPALSPWGPVPASESKGESHLNMPDHRDGATGCRPRIRERRWIFDALGECRETGLARENRRTPALSIEN